MKFCIRNRNEFIRIADQLAPVLDGSAYSVTVTKFERQRTNPQNAKVHALIRDLAAHCGYPEPHMKDVLKAEFAPIVSVNVGNRVLDVPKGTSDMTVEEMGDFMEMLYQLGAEIGCVFTDP